MSIENGQNRPPETNSVEAAGERRRPTNNELMRLGDMASMFLKQGATSPEFGTDLDPNKSGNIWAETAAASRREAHEREWSPLTQEIAASGADYTEAMGMVARHSSENGVAAMEDGSYVMKMDNQATTVNRNGTPIH